MHVANMTETVNNPIIPDFDLANFDENEDLYNQVQNFVRSMRELQLQLAAHATAHKSGGSDVLLSAPGPIGDTTPGTGKFTNVEVTEAAPGTPAIDTIYKESIARAWVIFDGTGPSPVGSAMTISNSFNVSSVTRRNTGQYRVAFQQAFANGNYVQVGSPKQDYTNKPIFQNWSQATTYAEHLTRRGDIGSGVDNSRIEALYFGDQ